MFSVCSFSSVYDFVYKSGNQKLIQISPGFFRKPFSSACDFLYKLDNLELIQHFWTIFGAFLDDFCPIWRHFSSVFWVSNVFRLPLVECMRFCLQIGETKINSNSSSFFRKPFSRVPDFLYKLENLELIQHFSRIFGAFLDDFCPIW